MPVPDEVAVTTDVVIQKLQVVAEQVGEMDGRASPGFDCVAVPFIKYATVLCPQLTGQGTERARPAGCTQHSSILSKHTTPSQDKHFGNTCSAHACPLPFRKSFRLCTNEYVLKDGEKTARVHPNAGVKQGCPLLPLIFSLYVDDIDDLAEGVCGAVTGTYGVHVTHLLYADDLSLTANDPNAMQTMLNRLDRSTKEAPTH
eukprot:962219-Pelagomonas_calceolata.AAC.1